MQTVYGRSGAFCLFLERELFTFCSESELHLYSGAQVSYMVEKGYHKIWIRSFPVGQRWLVINILY